MAGDLTDRYIPYLICFLGSLVPAAVVGWVVAVLGALFDDALSTLAFVQAVIAAALVAGATFYALMRGLVDAGEELLLKVSVVVCLSAIVLVALGRAAATSQSLGSIGAGVTWLILMLTLGYIPFSRNWGAK